MNNEFEWRNQLRKLGGAVEPANDLWPRIAARLGTAARLPARHRFVTWMALAAALIAAVGAGYLAVERPQPRPAASAVVTPAPRATPGASHAPEPGRTALDWAVPANPALVASAQHLDNASAELQDALEQRPDAVFLVGLLNRTNAMRLRLMRKSPNPG
jgi:hypothetical protein